MNTATKVTGERGEALVSAYLVSRNFDVLERNVRFGRYEIDIVAYDRAEKMMVFVEVKSRSRQEGLYPIRTAITPRKRRAMREGVFRWVSERQYDGPARLDVICVAQDRITEHLMDIGSDFF